MNWAWAAWIAAVWLLLVVLPAVWRARRRRRERRLLGSRILLGRFGVRGPEKPEDYRRLADQIEGRDDPLLDEIAENARGLADALEEVDSGTKTTAADPIYKRGLPGATAEG